MLGFSFWENSELCLLLQILTFPSSLASSNTVFICKPQLLDNLWFPRPLKKIFFSLILKATLVPNSAVLSFKHHCTFWNYLNIIVQKYATNQNSIVVEWLAAATERISHQMRDNGLILPGGLLSHSFANYQFFFERCFLNPIRSSLPIKLGRCQGAVITLGNLLAIVYAG